MCVLNTIEPIYFNDFENFLYLNALGITSEMLYINTFLRHSKISVIV